MKWQFYQFFSLLLRSIRLQKSVSFRGALMGSELTYTFTWYHVLLAFQHTKARFVLM